MQSFYTLVTGCFSSSATPQNNGKKLFPSPGIKVFIKSHYLTTLLLFMYFIVSSGLANGQTCTCSGTNLVQNSSWESGTTNWNWSGGNLTTGTNGAQCGTNAGHFQITNAANNWVSQQIGTVGTNGITTGSIITLKVYGGTFNPSFYHQVGVSYYTNNWTYITGNYTEVNAQLPSMSEYTVTSTVPANAYYITVEKGGTGDWLFTDRWCATVSQCDPDNSSAPPYCAPSAICPSGNNFSWSQSINSTDGTPSVVRLVCSSTLSYTIPGPYPSDFNGPVNVTVSDVVSWDGYSGRGGVTQQNERWRLVFKKNGNTVYTTPYTDDVPDLRTQGYWRGSLGTSAFLPNGTDQIIIEHWSAANNTNCSNGPNAVVPVSVCIGFSQVTCNNVTNGGEVGISQTSCLASFDPAPFTNITSPSGGSGILEYQWMKSTTTCIAPNGSNDNEWEVIPNSNSASYDPGMLYQNTCYIRLSRRSGCVTYDGKSNVVSVTVSSPAVQIGSSLTLVKNRVITNEVHCSNSNQRVLWMDCLLDNSPGGNAPNAKYWRIISGGALREYCDGTAYYEMRVQNLVLTNYELDIKVVLSGRTYTAPPGSPNLGGCTGASSSDWYYYTNITGTISGVNGLAGALLSVDRSGSAFQVGTNASLFSGPGQFGASGSLLYNVISHPTNFKLRTECAASFNFLLSGGPMTSGEASNCGSICAGSSAQLTANGGGGKPGYTYVWDNNLGSGQSKTVNPSMTTTYKVTITDLNGCTSTSQTTIHVNPQPVLNAGQNVDICQGQSVLLTVNATNGTSPYIYTWPTPPGGTGSSKSVSPAATTTYIITVTDAKGCVDTDEVVVTVNSNPSVNLSAPQVCEGSTLQISATPSGGSPTYSYAWTGPGGFSATTQNITRNLATPSMGGQYSVIVTDQKGCAAFGNVQATVNSKPTLSVSGPTQWCVDGTLTLNAQATGGTPGYTYTWSGPGGFSASGGSFSRFQLTPAMAGTYTVTVSDANGCTRTANHTITVTECEGEICFIGTNNNTVNAKSTYQIVYNADPAQNKLRIRTTFSKNFVDNTYGTNAIGWPSGHTFGNLTGSDHLQIALFDANNVKKMELKLDYLTASSAAPSGYKSLGVSGGDGSMIFGNVSDVLNVVTSLDQNFNTFGYVLTTNSPETNDDYQADPNYPNWIYDVWYEVEVKLSAFGAAGFGTAGITGIHASPSKTGNNTEEVEPGDCCVLFNPEIVGANFKCSGSNEPIQLTVTEGTTFLWSTGATTQTITVNPTQQTTYYVTVTDQDDCSQVINLEVNVIDCEGEICFVGNNEVSAEVKWTITYSVNENENKVRIKTTFSKNFVDNTYGVNAIGWPSGHTFGNLTGSDHLIISLFDNNNVKKMEMKMDYITASTDAPSGFRSLGVLGGDGSMILGNASDVISVRTSLDKNFNEYGYVLTTNSPATDNNYTPNPTYPNWIYEVWYETEVKLSAFGPSGFGTVDITGIHASPSKTGNNTEEVDPGPCCEFEAFITGDNELCEGQTTTLTANVIGNTTLEIPSTNDTYLDENNPTKNYGGCKEMYIGTKSGKKRRGLLKFDISSIPPGSNIVSADLFMTKTGGTNTSTSIGLYPVNATWSENAGGCSGNTLAPNWTQRASSTNWSTAGGDFTNTPAATTNMAGNGSYSWDVLSLVQNWIANPSNNRGVMIKTVNEGINDEFKLATSEEGDGAKRPYLNIIYQVPASGIAYLWSNGATTQTITVSPAQTTTYTVTVTAPDICDGGVSDLTVTVFEGPSVNITGNAEICRGETTILTANAPAAISFNWSTGATTQTISVNPTVSTTYYVTVTDVNGCTSSSSILVTTNPDLEVDLFTYEICAGSTLEISLTVNGGTPNYMYTWTGPGGFSAGTQNINRPNATVGMGGVYSVTVTDSRGCAGTATIPTTINPNPTVGASSNSPVCTGGTLTVSAIPSGGSPGYTYFWTGPGGFTAFTQNVNRPNATISMSGLYNVTVTDSRGCTAVSSVQATVSPGPGVVASSNSPVCEGETILLFAVPSGGTPTYAYSWSGPNGFTSNIQNPTIINATNAMSGVYSVTLTDGSGCLSTASTTVTTVSKPNSGIDGPSTTCAKEPAQFVALPPAGPGATYSWTFQGGIPASATGPSAISQWNTPGEYLITLVVTKDGCTATYTRTIIITQEVIALAGPDKEICQGGNVTLNGDGPAGANYTWTVVSGDPTSIDNGGNTLNILVSPLFTTVYRLTVSQNGCVRTDDVTVTVNVNLNPIADAGDPLTICSGTVVNIGGSPTGTPPPGAPNTTLGYIWSPGSGLNSITLPNPTLNLSTPGVYTYQVIVIALSTGCSDTASVTHTIVPKPTITANTSEICAGNTLVINSSVNGGTPVYTYAWSGPNGYSSSSQNISRANATAAMSGTYHVTVTDFNGCTASTSVQAIINPTPSVNATTVPVCEGGVLQITSTPSGGTPGYVFNWTGPGAYTNATQNIIRQNATVSMSGLYSLTVTDTKGCTGTTTVNAVVEAKAKVGDFVWEDYNGNGRQDAGEAGINGVTVSLYSVSSNLLVASTVTADRNQLPGYYEFEVCKGSYYIIFGEASGFTRTVKNAPGSNPTNDSDANVTTGRSDNFNLNPGDVNLTIDAGYYRLASLGDYVWEDLDVDGIQDFGEPGISGVVVRLLDQSGIQLRFTVTNLNGYYLFDNLLPGNYIVKFDTKPGYIPTTSNQGINDAIDSDADPITGRSPLVTLASGQTDLTIDAGFYRLARIGDFVWEDINLNNRQDPFEPVLAEVQVTLNGIKGTDGTAVNLVTFTDNMGRYDFNNLTPGTYTVTFTRPGSQYLSSTPNVGSDDLDSDADMVTGQTASYTLTSGQYNNTVDAGFYRCANVGDFVWIDLGPNPNVQDAGDVGINNVEVRLYQAFTNVLIGTQLTRNSPIDGRAGYYLFECIPPGTYYVKVIKPDPSGTIVRYDFVQPNQGGDDMLDSDVVDFLNGTTLNFTVGYAQTILDIDIGLISVLPVQIKELDGWWNKVRDINELYWITTHEVNNRHFVIERSRDDSRYEVIGKIESRGKNGSETNYTFDDADISSDGLYVYRISQVDFDGTTTVVGEVNIKVSRGSEYDVTLYPNPTKDFVNIIINGQAEEETAFYELYDAVGRVILKEQVVEQSQNGQAVKILDLSGINQGIYYLKVKVGSEQKVLRLIKVD